MPLSDYDDLKSTDTIWCLAAFPAAIPVLGVGLTAALANGTISACKGKSFDEGWYKVDNVTNDVLDEIYDKACEFGDRHAKRIADAAIVGFGAELGREAAKTFIKALRHSRG